MATDFWANLPLILVECYVKVFARAFEEWLSTRGCICLDICVRPLLTFHHPYVVIFVFVHCHWCFSEKPLVAISALWLRCQGLKDVFFFFLLVVALCESFVERSSALDVLSGSLIQKAKLRRSICGLSLSVGVYVSLCFTA